VLEGSGRPGRAGRPRRREGKRPPIRRRQPFGAACRAVVQPAPAPAVRRLWNRGPRHPGRSPHQRQRQEGDRPESRDSRRFPAEA
jgi:hypothetical protein